MTEKLETIHKISNRLMLSLSVMVIVLVAGGLVASGVGSLEAIVVPAPLAAFAAGMIGGFVGLQRRLKGMSEDDLVLLANSWVYVCLSPLVGGILAVVLYVLFISTLVSGELFPRFVADAEGSGNADFSAIFAVHGGAVDYAKMMFWSFVAGFSERFVTDIVSRFETGSDAGHKPKE